MRLTADQRDIAVALSAAVTLAYTAWGFGGVIAWSLHVLLAGGLFTLLLALMPVRRKGDQRSGKPGKGRDPSLGIGKTGSAAAEPVNARVTSKQVSHDGGKAVHSSRLPLFLRSFQFYAVLAFLGYLVIAALNPAWTIASNDRGWWLARQSPPIADWLPTSVESHYEPMNAWRIINMHLAAFSLALGLRLGLTRRRSLLFVLWAFFISTAGMAVVAIIQKTTGSNEVLWTYRSENQHFWGSFFYRNQAGAFLNWGIVIAGVLYFYHASRSRLEGRSGGPHFLALCLVAIPAVSVGLALSRGGILFAVVLVACLLLLVLIDYLYGTFTQLSRHTFSIVIPLSLALAALLGVGLYQAYQAVDWEAVEQRFGDIEATIEDADRDARALSSRATWDMAQDALWTGWGAGSFRYAFPIYQKQIPEIFYQRYHRRHGKWLGRKFYRYAHNDILQFLAEYGIIGSVLLLIAIFSFLAGALRRFATSGFAVAFLCLGLMAAAGHAFLDFIFHSPAYWVALIATTAAAARLVQLEAQRN